MQAVKIEEVRCSNYERETMYKSTSSQQYRKIAYGFSTRPFNPFSEPRRCLVTGSVCSEFLRVYVKILVRLGAIVFCLSTFLSFSVIDEAASCSLVGKALCYKSEGRNFETPMR
jgi:hypothetical protein